MGGFTNLNACLFVVKLTGVLAPLRQTPLIFQTHIDFSNESHRQDTVQDCWVALPRAHV